MAKLTPDEITRINQRIAAGTYVYQPENNSEPEELNAPKSAPKRRGRPKVTEAENE